MNAAKTAVAEHHDHIAALCVLADMIYNSVCVWQVGGWLAARADLLHEFFCIQSLPWRELLQTSNLRDNHGIGVNK